MLLNAKWTFRNPVCPLEIYCNFIKINVSPGRKVKSKRTVLVLNSEALPKNKFSNM